MSEAELRRPPKGLRRARFDLRVMAFVLVVGAAAVAVSVFQVPKPIGARMVAPVGQDSDPGKSDGRPASPAVDTFVGAKNCRDCHPGEAAAYAGSGHSKTLRRGDLSTIAKWLDGRTLKDPEVPDATWTYALAGGRLEVERAEKGKFQCFPLDYAVGSGANGVTFVTLRPPNEDGPGATGVEHRLSYISGPKKMNITPGQAIEDTASHRKENSPHGRTLDAAQLTKCLDCHSTVTASGGMRYVDPKALVPNVSCERCHGPGATHVALARKGAPEADLTMPMGLDSSGPIAQIESCGQCHRTLRTVSPGMVDERNPEISRFQPVGLEMSYCFQKGKSGLSCTSCHDPHARASRDHATYEAVCLKCHSATHRRSCPVSTTEGCIKCHMPKRTVSVDFQFTDHWIRRPKSE